MNELSVRIADEKDSEPFARWIAQSNQIPVEDVKASLKKCNPTSVTLVIEQDGKVILFAPMYALAMLGFIGFNPATSERQRLKGLDALNKTAEAFWKQHGVTTLCTLSKENYPIAKWAMHNGFEVEPRQVLVRTTQPETESAYRWLPCLG
jgi:hypothetical protein